jgi:hypothetical protein
MVGTPAAIVTFSLSIRSAMSCGVMRGPGNTSAEPDMLAVYGMPHALAWNIGTTGMTRSC